MEKENLIFKEITNKSELLEGLKLRYEIYQQSRVAAWTRQSTDQTIEMDGYDLTSRHYIMLNQDTWVPVAYMRVVQESKGRLAEAVLDIAKHFNIGIGTPLVPMPVMAYFPQAIHTIARLQSTYTKKVKLCEPGRFVISKDLRKLSFTRAFVEYVLDQNIDHSSHAVLSCVNTHVPFYSQYGFRVMAGTEPCRVHKDLPEVSLLVKEI